MAAEKPKKIPNLAIIGCSSSGKTTLTRKLAELYGGVAISLDAPNMDGRSSVSVGAKPKEFMEGDPYRDQMMKEAAEAVKAKKPFFIDDAFTDIIQRLNRRTTKIVLLLPTPAVLYRNIRARNIKAHSAGQERFASHVLRQLSGFLVQQDKLDKKQSKAKQPSIEISPKDLVNLLELDKMFYDQQDWNRWEAVVLETLHLYGFSILSLSPKSKNKPITFVAKDIGQHITIINDKNTEEIIKEILDNL